MLTKHTPGMIRAGALYYTVLISFIISGLLSALLYMNYLNNRFVNTLIMQDKIAGDAASGIQWFVSDPSVAGYDSAVYKDLYGKGADSVLIKRKTWGCYDVILSNATWRNHSACKIALAGAYAQQKPPALYMADEKKYLTVSGRSFIRGKALLPALGIRRGVIEGRFFSYQKEIQGEIQTSESALPKVSGHIMNFILPFTEGVFNDSDSVIFFHELNTDSYSRSFNEKTMVVFNDGPILLKNMMLQGNIILVSLAEIKVYPDASLNNTLLIAPKIFIGDGFRGQLQAFATDSLVVGSGCYLQFPSVVAIANKDMNTAHLTVYENSVVAGAVLLLQDKKPVKPSKVFLDKKTRIYGQVYVQGVVEHRGEIYGSLFCRGFALKTKSAHYDNHLLDAVIDMEGLPKGYSWPVIFEGAKTMDVIDWLQ